MRKKLTGLTALMLSLLLVACGNGNGNSSRGSAEDSSASESKQEETAQGETVLEEAKVEPLDLTGLWLKDGKSESESHMVATIRDDGKIGVFFILEDDPEPWTYWVGTYVEPTDDIKEYSWTSESTYSGNGLLASTDDTKEFTYKEDKISYQVTMEGESRTIELIRGDWDTSAIPDSAFSSVDSSTSDVKEIEIKDSAWYIDGGCLKYYIVLHNPNEKIAVELPSFRITARDADGSVIDTEDQTLSVIYPEQDFYYVFQAFSVDSKPEKVDFEILPTEDYNLKDASTLNEFKQLEVINTSEKKDKFVGEVKNPNDNSYDMAVVLVVGKDSDGNVVYVNSTFINDIEAGATVPFSISNYSDIDISIVEYYANQWM